MADERDNEDGPAFGDRIFKLAEAQPVGSDVCHSVDHCASVRKLATAAFRVYEISEVWTSTLEKIMLKLFSKRRDGHK